MGKTLPNHATPPADVGRATRCRSHASRHAGFTTLELIIVAAIILVLLSLAVVGFTVRDTIEEKHQTYTVLAGAAAVETEYRTRTGGQVIKIGESGDQPPTTFPTSETFEGDNTIEQFVSAVREVPECRELLEKLPRDLIHTDDDAIPDTILDGWGQPLKYAAWVTDDQSVLPISREPFFASSGEDLAWGDATSTVTSELAEAEDNLYSFDDNAQ